MGNSVCKFIVSFNIKWNDFRHIYVLIPLFVQFPYDLVCYTTKIINQQAIS